MTGYDYGNARLRARKSRFLLTSDYQALLGASDLDGLLGLLSGTHYGPDIEAVLPRLRSIRRLDGAVAHNVGRTLEEMSSFYTDQAGRAVALLLERWDLRNVQAVLRGIAAHAAPADIAATLVPAGTIPGAVLRSLTGAADLRTLLDLLVSLGVPSARHAARLLEAWPAYTHSSDAAVLEYALHQVYAARWAAELADLDLSPLSLVFRRETDRANVLAALRLVALSTDATSDLVEQHRWLDGRLDRDTLMAAATASGPEEAADLLIPLVPTSWGEALRRWAADRDTARVALDIDVAITRELISLFTSGDPLGIDIPVAFTAMLENEARNVRYVARSVASGRPAADTLAGLVMP